MVVFTCSSCGESLKKNQVEKHYQFRCHDCQYLTCMDCNKEFWGNDYEKHTKCVSEDQRYGGKDYVPKPNSNKGEVKQESWIEHVKSTISTTRVPRNIAMLMEQLMNFENIPRKKAKFENFVKNSLRLRDPKIIGEVWDLFAKSQEDTKIANQSLKNGDVSSQPESHESNIQSPPSESKKRKQEVVKSDENSSSFRNKKVKADVSLQAEPEVTNSDDQTKFKWTKVIKNILREYPDYTMSLKKLQKKVLKEYRTVQSDYSIEKDELKSKLQIKIDKCAKLKIEGDQIMLTE